MASKWANSFKSKNQMKLSAMEKDLSLWNERKKNDEKEILAGAPTRDCGGVVALKNSLRNAINEIGKLERAIPKMKLKVEQEKALSK